MPNVVYCSKLAQAYNRYIGPLGFIQHSTQGENVSTHVASVRLDAAGTAKPERAIVKFFRFADHGWLNEYTAWNLAQHLGVKTSPRAALLIGSHKDITKDHGPELKKAAKYTTDPIVLWCTSAVEPTLPVQQALGVNWEHAAMRIDSGQRLAAMDAWLGNCDRIPNNTLYWTAGSGGLVAIDHEKSVFNQDWSLVEPMHLDDILDASGNPVAESVLLKAIKQATKSKDSAIKKAARTAKAKLFDYSRNTHLAALDECQADVTAMATANFTAQASQHLLSFLSFRISEDCQKRRYGLML